MCTVWVAACFSLLHNLAVDSVLEKRDSMSFLSSKVQTLGFFFFCSTRQPDSKETNRVVLDRSVESCWSTSRPATPLSTTRLFSASYGKNQRRVFCLPLGPPTRVLHRWRNMERVPCMCVCVCVSDIFTMQWVLSTVLRTAVHNSTHSDVSDRNSVYLLQSTHA